MMKDHKMNYPDCKIRPVQPINASAIEKMDILISAVLTQLQPFLKYRILNREPIQKDIQQLTTLASPHIQASLDLENMFPTTPINDKALKIVREYLKTHRASLDLFGLEISHIMIMLEFVLHNTCTKIGDSYYKLTSGLGTGSHSSTPYGDIIIDWTYTQAINISTMEPTLIKTFVDDCYLIWPGDEASFLAFKDILNTIWPTLNFTHQFADQNNQIPFLDMNMVLDSTSGKVHYTFYQKPTHSGKYLHYTSHCAMITKINLIKSEAKRIINNCMYKEHSWPFLEKLKKDLLNSGYPEKFLNQHIVTAISEIYSNSPPKPKKTFDFLIKKYHSFQKTSPE